jgi:hypothetical protein
LVGVAVNVTELPRQTGLADAETATLTGRFGLTVIQIWFDNAGFPVVQGRTEVSSHVMQSPLSGIQEKMELFDPVFTPFIFQL